MSNYVKNEKGSEKGSLFDSKKIKAAYKKTKSAKKHPTSINLSEETVSELKALASKTKTVKATTYDVGADYFFLQDRLRPLIGVHAATLNIEGDGEINLQGFTKSGVHAYSSLGIVWVAENGFQAGTGMKYDRDLSPH